MTPYQPDEEAGKYYFTDFIGEETETYRGTEKMRREQTSVSL